MITELPVLSDASTIAEEEEEEVMLRKVQEERERKDVPVIERMEVERESCVDVAGWMETDERERVPPL